MEKHHTSPGPCKVVVVRFNFPEPPNVVSVTLLNAVPVSVRDSACNGICSAVFAAKPISDRTCHAHIHISAEFVTYESTLGVAADGAPETGGASEIGISV